MTQYALMDNKFYYYNRTTDAAGGSNGDVFYSHKYAMLFDSLDQAQHELNSRCMPQHAHNFAPVQVKLTATGLQPVFAANTVATPLLRNNMLRHIISRTRLITQVALGFEIEIAATDSPVGSEWVDRAQIWFVGVDDQGQPLEQRVRFI